jgi:hypothetical protein
MSLARKANRSLAGEMDRVRACGALSATLTELAAVKQPILMCHRQVDGYSELPIAENDVNLETSQGRFRVSKFFSCWCDNE